MAVEGSTRSSRVLQVAPIGLFLLPRFHTQPPPQGRGASSGDPPETLGEPSVTTVAAERPLSKSERRKLNIRGAAFSTPA